MAVLLVLGIAWLVGRGMGAAGVSALDGWRASAPYALAAMFLFTGIAHFNQMRYDLVQMVPRVFPRPFVVLYITGVLEFAGAAGLLLPKLRALAGICLIVLLVAMFPANVKAALGKLKLRGKPATPLWFRAPMQLLFIGLLWWSTQPSQARISYAVFSLLRRH